jgi:hypothetical protein
MNGNPPPTGFTPDTTPPPAKTSGWAVGALVTGIMGVACLPPFIPTVLSILFGIIGLNAIRTGQGRLAGSGMCVAGIILGVVAILTNLVGVGIYYVGKMSYDVATTIQAVNPVIESQNWDKFGEELSGPGALSREEIKAKFEAGFAEYGPSKSATLANVEVDPTQTKKFKDISKLPLILGVNLDCESGPANIEFRLRRIDGKMRATDLRFSKGHLPVRIRASDFE